MSQKKRYKNKKWYKEYHRRSKKNRFHKVMLVIFVFSTILSSVYVISVKTKNALAFTDYTWDMGTPAEYTYDPAKITFDSGIAKPAGAYSLFDSNPYGINCPDVSTCYGVGQNGQIIKTSDGGANWVYQTSGVSVTLTNIYCPNANTCYVVGDKSGGSGTILKTTNGGTNWSSQASGINSGFNGVYCIDVNTCYVVGDNTGGGNGAIRKTINGGTNWNAQDSGTTAWLTSIHCIDANTCYVVGIGGKIIKTINGGTNWNSQTSGTTKLLYGVYCPNSLVCYAVGADGTIQNTTNGGATSWVSKNSGTSPDDTLMDVFCSDTDNCITVGLWGGGDIFKTTNGGTNWSGFATGHQLWPLDCPETNKCYTGGNQYLIKTLDGNNWMDLHYGPTSTIVPVTSQDYSTITGFKETLDASTIGTIYYQVSNNDGSTWYWYDGSSWSIAPDVTHRNTASAINQNIPTFTGSYNGGTGKFKWRAVFYGSSTVDSQKLDSIQISILGTSPNAPRSLEIADISNREKEVWAVALTWDEPVAGGGSIDFYKIERSDNGGPWAEVGTTNDGTKKAFAEIVPSSGVTYSYRVRAVAHDAIGGLYNDESEPSNIVSMMPTGKYTTMPGLIGSPTISVTATSATVSWSTDRVSSSAVEYGLDNSYGTFVGGSGDSVTSHSVTIRGLGPGTTYHYRIQSLDPERTYGSNAFYPSDYTFATTLSSVISGLKISDVRSDSALLSFQTNSDMSSTVHYGKTTDYGSTIGAGGGTNHSLRIIGLDDSSQYHLRVIGTDADGNPVQSDDYSFETLAFPKVSDIQFEPIKDRPTSTVKVVWNTNIPTSSVIEYTGPEGKTESVSEYQLVTDHEIVLSGLKDNAEYTLVAKGRDAFGNEASSGRQKITTEVDTRPPEISEITTETSINGYGSSAKAQMIVSWSTDEPATSQVEYSKGVSGEVFENTTQEDKTLATSHAVVISDLKPSSSYYFRVITKDDAGNEAKSEIKSALTSKARMSIFDIMIKSFDSTLGWLFGSGRF